MLPAAANSPIATGRTASDSLEICRHLGGSGNQVPRGMGLGVRVQGLGF